MALKYLAVLAVAFADEPREEDIQSVTWETDAKEDDPQQLVNPAPWDGDMTALQNLPDVQHGPFGGHANDEDAGEEPMPQDLVRDGTEDEKDYYGMTKARAHKDFGELWVRRAWRRCFFFDCKGALRFVWSDFHCGCGYSQKLWRYCVRLQNRLSWRRYWNYYRFMRCGSFWPFGGPGAWWNRFGPCGNCVWCRHHPRPIIVVKKVAAVVSKVRVGAPVQNAPWPAPVSSPWPAPASNPWPAPASNPWPAPASNPWPAPAKTCQKEYDTCGGQFAGPDASKGCCPGLKCVKCSMWYSQCRYDDHCPVPAPAPWSAPSSWKAPAPAGWPSPVIPNEITEGGFPAALEEQDQQIHA